MKWAENVIKVYIENINRKSEKGPEQKSDVKTNRKCLSVTS